MLRPVQVEIDPDFYGKRHKDETYAGQYAKFTQDENFKKLLLATGNANLSQYVKGSPPVVFDNLMIIRDKIKKAQM